MTTPDHVLANGLRGLDPVLGGGGLTAGEANFDRNLVQALTVATGTGFLRGAYFTAARSETISQVKMWTGGTAAGATPSLVRVGIWTASDAGALVALVGSTANDTALLAAASTEYAKSLSASFLKRAGQRYFVGLLVVTAAAAPTMVGSLMGGNNAIMGLSPVVAAQTNPVADLPASVAAGSMFSGLNRPFIVLLP